MSILSWWSNLFGNEVRREVGRTARLSLEEQALRTHEIARAKAEKAENEAERAAIRQRDRERAEAKKGVVGSLAIARQEAAQAAASAQEAKEVLAGARASYEALLEATSGPESDPIGMGARSRAVEEGRRIAARANALISVAAGWETKVASLEAKQQALLAADLQGAGMSVNNAEWAASKTWEEHQVADGKGPEERAAERREQAAAERMSSWLTPEEGAKALAEWSKAIDTLSRLRDVREAWETQSRTGGASIATDADLVELKPAPEALAPAGPPTWEASQQHAMAQLAGLQDLADRCGWEPEVTGGDALDHLGAAVAKLAPEERAAVLGDDDETIAALRVRLADLERNPVLGPDAMVTADELREEARLANEAAEARLNAEIEATDKERMAEIEGRAEVARQWAEWSGSPMTPDPAAGDEVASRARENDQLKAEQARRQGDARRPRTRESAEELHL